MHISWADKAGGAALAAEHPQLILDLKARLREKNAEVGVCQTAYSAKEQLEVKKHLRGLGYTEQ